VALTRARDRLYLSGTAASGKLILQRGSLGRVLPAALMAAVATGVDPEFVWLGRSSAHRIRRVPPAGETPRAWRPSLSLRERLVDLEPFEVRMTSKPVDLP